MKFNQSNNHCKHVHCSWKKSVNDYPVIVLSDIYGGFFLLQELNIDPVEVENLLVSCILDKYVHNCTISVGNSKCKIKCKFSNSTGYEAQTVYWIYLNKHLEI